MGRTTMIILTPKPSHRLYSSGALSVRRKDVPLDVALLSGAVNVAVQNALNINVQTAAMDLGLRRAIPQIP